MHLTLLSRSTSLYTTHRVVDAARLAGHRVRVLDALACQLHLGAGETSLLYRGRPLPPTDVCLPRIGQSVQAYGLAVLDQLERRGIPLLNTAAAIARARNKLRCLELLTSEGIPVPSTVLARDVRSLKGMLELVGGCPVLLKLLQGGERAGFMVCETPQSMEAALEALLALGHDVLLQEYLRDRRGRDLRALVVGGKVVAVVRRVARIGRLGRTLRAGARFEAARLKPSQVDLAERTARLVGLEVAAIDMLEAAGGTKVFEINASPGIQEVEGATGVDVAHAVVSRAEELVGEARRKNKKRASRVGPSSKKTPPERA